MYSDDARYSDYIRIPEGFVPNMTREDINKSPDTWLGFFPHESYLKLLDTLIGKFQGRTGTISLWITGSYGTGKTNAALVTQKLFQKGEDERVKQWFDQYDSAIPPIYKGLRGEVEKCREEKTLVVYDYNGSNLGPGREFIVRMEKSVIKALEEEGYTVPAGAKFQEIADRIRREGPRFVEIRDRSGYRFHDKVMSMETADELADMILNSDPMDGEAINIIRDAEEILEEDSIFLVPDASGFIEWIKNVREVNGISRIVYIFDEFSDFIENNKQSLKTFEDISEGPHNTGFFFVPVTHMDLKSFQAENSASAGKAKNRFDFVNLSMPDNIAFKLMSHAMGQNVPRELESEWEGIKDELWEDIEDVAKELDNGKDRRTDDFKGILPVHPMAGLLLKTLSDVVGSNQRSVFEYLKDGSREGTFSTFIKEGGPCVDGKEILTTDYLWGYFIEREDPIAKPEVRAIRAYYDRFRRSQTFLGRDDSDPQLRVLRTALLFILLSDLSRGEGDAYLMPTRSNIELAYKGFSEIGNVGERLSKLKEASCITLSPNGDVSLFASSIDDAKIREKAEEISRDFGKNIAKVTSEKLEPRARRSISEYPSNRFDVKVSEGKSISGSIFSDKDRFQNGGPKDVGEIRLWFLISKSREDNNSTASRVNEFLETYGKDFRVVLFYFKEATFCYSDEGAWEKYAECRARESMVSSQKDVSSKERRKYEDDWTGRLTRDSASIMACYWDGEIKSEQLTWATFNGFIGQRVDKFFPRSIDHLIESPQNALKSNMHKACAKLGMNLSSGTTTALKGIERQLKDKDLTTDESWFDNNPDHTLSLVHSKISVKLREEISNKGYFSLNSAFKEFRKPPYGFQPVGMTSVVLGFCMKDVLGGQYQWTDKKISGEMTQDVLAEIIEAAVMGNESKQKYICEISEDEREFYDKAPRMFGVEESGESLNGTIELIQNRIKDESGKAPLWTLKGYIESQDDPLKDDIIQILDDICPILGASSKSKDSEGRIAAVRKIGGKLLKSPELVEGVSRYTDRTTFRRAFKQFLDKNELIRKRAEEVGDVGGNYVDAVLNKMSESSSYLWKETNADDSISEVVAEYGIVAAVMSLKSIDRYIEYPAAREMLEESIRNALPSGLVKNEFPHLSDYQSKVGKLKDNNNASVLEEVGKYLRDNEDEIRSIYFDDGLEGTVGILRKSYKGSIKDLEGLSDDDLKVAFRRIDHPGVLLAESFRSRFQTEVEKIRSESAVVKLKDAWTEKTGTESPAEWETRYRMPSRYAFRGEETRDLASAMKRPRDYSTERLESISEALIVQDPPEISVCQEAFMAKTVSAPYRDMGLNFTEVTNYLYDKYGDPGKWPAEIDVSEMVRDAYSKSVAPAISDKIGRMDPQELKDLILSTINENEDLGIQLLHVITNDNRD